MALDIDRRITKGISVEGMMGDFQRAMPDVPHTVVRQSGGWLSKPRAQDVAHQDAMVRVNQDAQLAAYAMTGLAAVAVYTLHLGVAVVQEMERIAERQVLGSDAQDYADKLRGVKAQLLATTDIAIEQSLVQDLLPLIKRGR